MIKKKMGLLQTKDKFSVEIVKKFRVEFIVKGVLFKDRGMMKFEDYIRKLKIIRC